MKRIYTLFLLLLVMVVNVFAQGNVGIGTNNPNSSAKLEISTADDAANQKKGLIIPNVELTSTATAAPIASPATSLLVYNTATNGTVPNNVTPGYYYWDGAKWVKFMVNNNNTIDLGYILGWSSNMAPPDYLLPLNGGTYNWADYPDFKNFHTSYPCQFIASSNATTFTLKNINTSKRFLRGSTTAGADEDGSTKLPTIPFTTNTTGAHTHSIDPPNTTTSSDGNHTHTLQYPNEKDESQGYPASGFNAVWATDRSVATGGGGMSMAGNHTHSLDITAFNSASAGDHSHTVNGGGDTETRPINTSVVWCIKVKPTATSGTINITNSANTAINGLSVYGSAIGLGGNLNQNTVVQQAGNNFAFDGTGNIGIGYSNPTNKLTVNGTIQAIDFGVSGTPNILIGDDAFLTDVDQTNITGLYGQGNPGLGGLD